jgi:hypothetical protein
VRPRVTDYDCDATFLHAVLLGAVGLTHGQLRLHQEREAWCCRHKSLTGSEATILGSVLPWVDGKLVPIHRVLEPKLVREAR